MKLRKNPNKALIKAVNNFFPWDYGYLLEIEKQALKLMLNYFDSEKCMIDRSEIVPYIRLAIKMLDIIDMTDSATKLVRMEGFNCETVIIKYVNMRNAGRFFNKIPPSESSYFMDELRIQKAWHLYHLIRLRYMRYFWD